jgi:nucleoside-diphosphate-sugar epimerase
MSDDDSRRPARYVVAGGAGFLGSHLCETLLHRGHTVTAVDNLSTGSLRNVAHLEDHPGFTMLVHDVCASVTIDGPVDVVLNFASPASPPRYSELSIETLRVGSVGTEQLLLLALHKGARFVQASTSEVYGDPLVHPQTENYWGHVNPIGLRSMYDEAKRFSEALIMAYRRRHQLDTGIVRIFNTYGPRMDPWDGRVVTNFVRQAVTGEPITVYGDGSQTRSFCYVSDLVDGLIRMLASAETGPINLGNPIENTVRELAMTIIELTGSTSELTTKPLPEDDPALRRPDISKARELLGWQPTVDLRDGLLRTIAWQRELAASR